MWGPIIAAVAGAGANKLFSSKGGGNDETSSRTPQFYPGFDRLANPLIGGTLGSYNRPYQEYPDETVAPLNDDQYTGIAALRAAYEDPTSRGRYDDIARRFSAAASRQAAPGTSSAIQARMNPYQDLVIDRALARMNTEDQTSMRNLRAANAGRNKFGSGAALSEATLAGAQDQNRGDAITRLLQSGFGNAQSQFNTDNEMANRTAGENRLALGNAASAVGQGDSANLAKIQALIGGGGMEQGNTQQYMTDRYNRWNQGQGYGDEQNRKAASILFASPQGSTQTSPGPSAFGQGAGLGLAAYGLATRNGKNPFDFSWPSSAGNYGDFPGGNPSGMWANGGIARFANGGGGNYADLAPPTGDDPVDIDSILRMLRAARQSQPGRAYGPNLPTPFEKVLALLTSPTSWKPPALGRTEAEAVSGVVPEGGAPQGDKRELIKTLVKGVGIPIPSAPGAMPTDVAGSGFGQDEGELPSRFSGYDNEEPSAQTPAARPGPPAQLPSALPAQDDAADTGDTGDYDPWAPFPPDRAAGTEKRERLAEIIQDLAGRGRALRSEVPPDASAAALPEVDVPERMPARALGDIAGGGGEAPPPVPPSADMLMGADKSSTGSRYQEIIDELLKRQDPKSDLSHMLMKAGAAMMASKSRTALGAAGEGLGAALDESTKLGEKDMDRRLKAAGLLGTLDSKQQALMQRASEAAQRAQASQSRLESAERMSAIGTGTKQAAIDAKIQYEKDRNEARYYETLVRAATANRATDQKREAATGRNANQARKISLAAGVPDKNGNLTLPDGSGGWSVQKDEDGTPIKYHETKAAKTPSNLKEVANSLVEAEGLPPGTTPTPAHFEQARQIITRQSDFMIRYYTERAAALQLPGGATAASLARLDAAAPPAVPARVPPPAVAAPGAPPRVPGAPPRVPPPAVAAPAAGSSRGTPIRGISSDAEFNKLPKGTWFVNPIDGKILQKKTDPE